MSVNSAATPVLHVQHSIEIPFAWAKAHEHDEGFKFETWERIEAEGTRLCSLHSLDFDPAGSTREDGIRLKGNSLDAVMTAGVALAEFLQLQEGLTFLKLTGDEA